MSFNHWSNYVAAAWHEVSLEGRCDCPLCGYTSLFGERVLRLEHKNGRRNEICVVCASSVQAADPAPLHRRELLASAQRLAGDLSYSVYDIEEILEEVRGDETLAMEICREAEAAKYINPHNFFAHHWLPKNEARIPKHWPRYDESGHRRIQRHEAG